MNDCPFQVSDFQESQDNFSLIVKNRPGTDEFHRKVYLIVKKEEFSTLIQTDKAIYKPGDKIQYRILALDENTKPYAPKKITLSIVNSKTRTVHDAKLDFNKGIYSGTYKLPKEACLGLWNVVVKQNTIEVHA